MLESKQMTKCSAEFCSQGLQTNKQKQLKLKLVSLETTNH